MDSVFRAALDLMASGEPAALATVIRVSGSTPQQPGARILLTRGGSIVGTVGGGRIEQVVLEQLSEVLASGHTKVVKHHLTRQLGMCCGGEMELFLEPLSSTQRLYFFGAGHIALPTARLAKEAGFAVTIIDEREELNTPERFPDAVRLTLDPEHAIERELTWGSGSFVVICTHDHNLDMDLLRRCARQKQSYLGLVGSRRKVTRLVDQIQQREPDLDLSRVRGPVGLDIGAVSPAEIGISIVSEMIAVLRGGTGQPMSNQPRKP